MSETNSTGQEQKRAQNAGTSGSSGTLSLKTLDKSSISIVLATFILMFCFGLINSCTGYFIAPVTEGLGISRTSFNFYYTIMVGLSIFTAPVLAKKILPLWGIPRLVAIGGVICGISLFAFSFADSIWTIYALSLVIGIFQLTCTNVVIVSVLNSHFVDKSGTVMGIAMSGTGFTTLLMSAVLPSLIEGYGWRMGYRFQGTLCVLLMLAAALILKTHSAGAVPAEKAAENNEAVYREEGVSFAEAVHSPRLYYFMAAFFIMSLCTCFLTQMPAYFTDMGVGTAMLSLIMSIAAVALTASKIALGAICDLIGKRLTVIIVLSVYVLSFLILMINGTAFFIIGAVCISIGMSAATVLPPLISRELFGLREYAAIWAVANSVGHAGGAIGGTVWGLLYDLSGSYSIGMKLSPLLLLFVMLIWSSQAKAKAK